MSQKILIVLALIAMANCTPIFYDYNSQSSWPTLCTTGVRQSPIDFPMESAKVCPTGLTFNYNYSIAKLFLKHFQQNQDMKNPLENQTFIDLTENSTISRYNSNQFHWHSPSEHRINGKIFDLQVHIVHKSTGTDGRLAVIGILFSVDKSPSPAPTIFDFLNFVKDKSGTSRDFMFPLNDKFLLHYKGSLTTPPCSQVVDFFIYAQPFKITPFQLQRIIESKNLGKPNSRNIQSLNGRTVDFYHAACVNYTANYF